jgi:hypothetical protein
MYFIGNETQVKRLVFPVFSGWKYKPAKYSAFMFGGFNREVHNRLSS